MNKYERLQGELAEKGEGKMKCFGNSMVPLLESGGLITFEKVTVADCKVGDKVFCKVKGRWIDCHLVTKFDSKGRAMIANNHGWENGWTKNIFGRAVHVKYDDGREFNI